jgi:hypothetical protein
MGRWMKLAEIERVHEFGISRVHSITDRNCSVRAKQLVGSLQDVSIDKISMGMGAWILVGDDVDFVYDDGSEGRGDLQDVVYIIRDGTMKRLKARQSDVDALVELVELCEWWLMATGGCDVAFNPEQD